MTQQPMLKVKLTTNEIRNAFLEFFKNKQHEIVSSSSLIPDNDPTLLFTNAGMVQFKDTFLGLENRAYVRATSSQRCVRAGGKHNDLENVGYTARHHTFFEMLGNFSFGDYFKREAIAYAWEFLTQVLHLPPEKLWITVFKDDQESEDIWLKEMKVDPKRFSRCGEKDNFWSMGETGPCGPCTEIFYDHGPEIAGGPPGTPDEDGDRYIEVWNLVFMQYDRDNQGHLHSLPKPCVDTGMGLERIAAVIQGVHDNYDIDLFQALLKALAKIIECEDVHDKSMRVIVDHIRSTSFLITDGVTPSNEGRGYVLRRIIRRAVRHGYKLGQREPFFYKLVKYLVKEMGEAYPLLKKSQAHIEQVLEQEEIQFAHTLSKGMKIFDQEVAMLQGNEVPGKVVFTLYDTYGFPPDLTADIARERGLNLDYTGFDEQMSLQRGKSKDAQKFSVDYTKRIHIEGETEFTGYELLQDEANITALIFDEAKVDQLSVGQSGIIVLDRTPFYAESGGQVGDTGYIRLNENIFHVQDTRKKGTVILHFGEMIKGKLKMNDKVVAEVDEARQDIILNHSATHLLHEALRRILGEHVTQKGSLVEAKRLRFDFSHSKALTQEEIHAVERLVNQQIRANLHSKVAVGTLEDAERMGAMALFGEKYGEQIRIVAMGDFSTEVCGGTHAERTGDIGLFKITSEAASASGIRRIEAVTGNEALALVNRQEEQLLMLGSILKSKPEDLLVKLNQLLEQNRQLSKELQKYKQQAATKQSGEIEAQAVQIQGMNVLAVELKNMDKDAMLNTMDQLKQKLGPKAAIVLATVQNNKVILLAGVTKASINEVKAGALLNYVAEQVGGKGGGRPDLAQGGGDNPQALPQALQSVTSWVEKQLNN